MSYTETHELTVTKQAGHVLLFRDSLDEGRTTETTNTALSHTRFAILHTRVSHYLESLLRPSVMEQKRNISGTAASEVSSRFPNASCWLMPRFFPRKP